MKNKYLIMAVAAASVLASCDLELYPETGFNEGNVQIEEESEVQYTSREDMKGLRDNLYNDNMKNDDVQNGYIDWLLYSECRSGNAYGGEPTKGEVMSIEANKQDGENKNVDRDWNYYQSHVSNANQIICNIDRIKENDPSMTQKEYEEWKAEALCWRAYNLFKMSYIWGDIPLTTTIPPAINSENIEEVYDEYYPPCTDKGLVYEQIIEDLEFAVKYAPDVNRADKYLLSKAFATGLLARVYAEKEKQDWSKVKQYCEEVEAMGFELCDDYGEMWSYDETDAVRNTKESIFEVTWTRSSGNWVWMMFHRNAYEPAASYEWVKWITPSRELIALYDKEGDTERKNACIIFDECGWSNYYPNNAYAFMHKMPTNANSLILMRLGEIYLLHAEALTMLNDLDGAEALVNKIRNRAGLKALPSSAKASQTAMLDAVLHERQLELAFEGFYFFDLVRHDRAIEVNSKLTETSRNGFKCWEPKSPLTEETILMPIPMKALENNPSLVQNPGY